MNSSISKVCYQFTKANIVDISTLGNGLINDTFLVKTDLNDFVLQRINSLVFPEPELISENLTRLNQHIKQKDVADVKLKVPLLLYTIQQQPYVVDKQNNYWRALEYINNSSSIEVLTNMEQIAEVGFALGHFHCLLSDVNPDLFHDTLPGFHITPEYFDQYLAVKVKNKVNLSSEKTNICIKFIDQYKANINILDEAKKDGILLNRITHGDPKLNNFLFAKQTSKIISLIDLDTVKPGLVQYDIADCLRSCCHVHSDNSFDLKKCRHILKSYLQQVRIFFTAQDYEYLYPAIQLLPFELGLRFFTDYLLGNQYFKVTEPEQNLNRAIAQFYLCESIEKQEFEIKQIINEYS